MNLQTSTLKFDETGEPFHIQQAAQIRAFRAAWNEAGHARVPRISVSRSIFALIDDRDRTYFGPGGQEKDKIGFLDETTRAIFGRPRGEKANGKLHRKVAPGLRTRKDGPAAAYQEPGRGRDSGGCGSAGSERRGQA